MVLLRDGYKNNCRNSRLGRILTKKSYHPNRCSDKVYIELVGNSIKYAKSNSKE